MNSIASIYLLLIVLTTACAATDPAGGTKPSIDPPHTAQAVIPTAADFLAHSGLPEAPVPIGGNPGHEDNLSFSATLKQFSDRRNRDDIRALTDFLATHPDSPWRVAVLTNLGLLQYDSGRFSGALESFAAAWREGKPIAGSGTDKALVDRALGELVRMHARLGHRKELRQLLAEIEDRPLSGAEVHTGYNHATQSFSPQVSSRSVLVRTSLDPVRYELRWPDGRIDIFSRPDSGQAYLRKIFLTEQRDAQGNAVTLTYDAALRIVEIKDALGQVTGLAYEEPAEPYKITAVTDPFGRAASFIYEDGLLTSITDPVGIQSRLSYGTNQFIHTHNLAQGAKNRASIGGSNSKKIFARQTSKLEQFIGRPSHPEDWLLTRACDVDWPPPYSPMPWSIRGLEPVYTSPLCQDSCRL
ncbi:MAG: hypothetical protein L0Y39_03155 [Methylococcaceae bacterium]|nr:hypothetical protein [Methylococcaceae bacterium]